MSKWVKIGAGAAAVVFGLVTGAVYVLLLEDEEYEARADREMRR